MHTKLKEVKPGGEGGIVDIGNKRINDVDERELATDHISNKGPKHILLQNQLLFAQLSAFVKALESKSSKKLTIVAGNPLTGKDHHEEINFPVPLLADIIPKEMDLKDSLEHFAREPEHETRMYSVLIQVLHWATDTIKALPA